MSLDLESALRATTVMVAISILFQNFEFWRLRRALSKLSLGFPKSILSALLFVQFASALLLLAFGDRAMPALTISALFISTLMISVHFGGSFCGGADSMSLVVLSALCFATWFPEMAGGALVYIAVQSLLSYLVAGAIKIRNARWRSGEALRSHLSPTSSYAVPAALHQLADSKLRAKTASWGLILFELCAPLAALSPRALGPWLSVAILFHVGNFVIFGLNRFVWTWAATYPALIYFATRS